VKKKKKDESSLKSFAVELVKKKTKAQQKQSKQSLKSFIIELVIFAALVVAYFFLVLIFLPEGLKNLFDHSKPLYALAALSLIATQGVVLEIISAALLKLVETKFK